MSNGGVNIWIFPLIFQLPLQQAPFTCSQTGAYTRCHECLNHIPQRHIDDEGVSISWPLSVYEGFGMLGASGNKQDRTRALTPSLFNHIRGWSRPGAPQ